MQQHIHIENKNMKSQLESGNYVRVDALAPYTFRVRISKEDVFQESPLNRYGILRKEWPDHPCEIYEENNILHCKTSEAQLCVQLTDGQFTLQNPEGTIITHSHSAPQLGRKAGFDADFHLNDNEKLYGLGDVTRDRIQMRGTKFEMWIQDVSQYIPIPWLMSTQGWGLLINTTRRHVLDIGQTDSEILSFSSKQGELDFYLFAGESLPTLLDHYTELAGRPMVLPAWAYGLTFVCNQQANAREMLEDGLHFREHGLPCNVLGLEPGWMEKNYDSSVDKKWHPERFYLPFWSEKGPDTFLSAARRMGFKISMWLCCDYDFLYEAERRVQQADINVAQEKEKEFHSAAYEHDENIAVEIRMDKITKREEAWFEHLKKFVDQGVSAFKLDGAYQVCEFPDRLWGAGLSDAVMTDEQMHNLYPLLYNQQMNVGFREHTNGLRPLIYSAGGYTGIQQFSATWAGDTGGGAEPLVSLLNHGLTGHSNTTVDMHIFSAAGIHFGFLQPWSQLCSWAYWRHPWFLGDELEPIFKFYANLRSQLHPYIYSLAHIAAKTGMPILRAMPLMFTDDSSSDSLLTQYMLGDAFLVGAFDKNIHLPQGRWIDFWTGERYSGPVDMAYQEPEGRGGPLFLREGAIVPLGPRMDYWKQKPVDAIELHIFPAAQSSFVLTEDDGVTYDYTQGVIRETTYECRQNKKEVVVEISEGKGEYAEAPATRIYTIVLYLDERPSRVVVNGENSLNSDWDDSRNALQVTWTQTKEQRSCVLQCLHLNQTQ